MRRTICWAVFALLVSSGAVFPQARGTLRPVARPRLKVVIVRWFAARPAVCFGYGMGVPFAYPDPYPVPYPVAYPVPYPVWDFTAPLPTFGFVGSASMTHPQLVFKDGTTYTVMDYWRVNDQLHFITMEDGGTKSVPHTVPFGDLDVQRTTDADAAQGFRFMVRDEPIEQWLEHHGQHAPRRPRNKRSINDVDGWPVE